MQPISRRDSLKILGSSPLAIKAFAARSRKVPVGGHVWVYAAKQPKADPTPVLDQIFRDFRDAGLDGIELMHRVLLHDDAVETVRRLSDRYDVPVIGSSWEAPMWRREQHDAILGEARMLIMRLAKLKGRTLGISVGDARHKKTPQELDAQADVLRQVMAICANHGVTPNLHNHIYEVADGEYDLRGTLERLPQAKLGPDLGWVSRAGIDPVDFVRRYRDRMVFAHLRDKLADGKWAEAMGEGVIDYAAIGRLLHESGFSGALVIELAHDQGFQPTRPVMESLRLSRAYVRRAMGY